VHFQPSPPAYLLHAHYHDAWDTANTTWGPECVAYGSGLSQGDVAQVESFVIQARDPFGNNLTNSNGTLRPPSTNHLGLSPAHLFSQLCGLLREAAGNL